jgi:hypothetical protein
MGAIDRSEKVWKVFYFDNLKGEIMHKRVKAAWL